MAGPGMQAVRMTRPRGGRPVPMRDAQHQAADCAALDALAAGRPLRPPPFVFAARRLTAGQLEARRELRAAGGLAMPHEHDGAEAAHGDGLDQIVTL